MLLEDLFRRQRYYPLFEIYDSAKIRLIKKWKREGKEKEIVKGYEYEMLNDSSMYFNYLVSNNIKFPKRDFYIHWSEKLEPTYRDSVKLIVINDPRMKNKHANMIGIDLLEVNKDSTLIKLIIGYGTSNDIAVDERTFTYSFDEKNCKWIVLDSTIRQD